MNITQYLKRKDIRTMVDSADIENRVDKRSYQKNGMWYVHPIGVSISGKSVDILCPYCGEIHRHGNAPGHRVSHCLNLDNPGYVIVMGGESLD